MPSNYPDITAKAKVGTEAFLAENNVKMNIGSPAVFGGSVASGGSIDWAYVGQV